MHSAQANAESLHEELWRGLPNSNVYKQKKLTGLGEIGEERPERTELERRAGRLETDRHAELSAFLNVSGRHFNTVMLGVYHVVLQWYLDDVESLIGCCLLAPCTATLLPSYVYAEDDDSVDALLRDIERQRSAGQALEVDSSDGSSWGAKRSPVFYYAGVDGRVSPDSDVANLAETHLERRVIIAATTGANRAELSMSMPSAVSHNLGIEDFYRRYDTALSSLLSGKCLRVGELKEQLGKASQVPYRQIEEMQQRVIALWAKVLGVPKESLDERSSYYEVGGTSLNAFRLVNRVRVEFQRDISIWDIVENPTVEQLSLVLLRD